MAQRARAAERPALGYTLGASVLLHAGLVALTMLAVRSTAGDGLARPPVYKVSLVAAPAGPRQMGVVQPPASEPVPAPAEPQPAPPAPEVVQPTTMPPPPSEKAPAERPPQRATPNITEKSAPVPRDAPVAGGGPEGGRGTDVANVQLRGIDFPYPAYLENVVRQIAVRFKPDNARSYTAEVHFKINRDGSVSELRLIKRSGDFLFDQEALGAVESAGKDRVFGSLPGGFSDDILPVFFSFDPKLIR
ncbi:MAG TPA: TonB C-terminal domain-containing protein [Gemmatimonadales bacterium]|nr:TonB C-terminal domain-containing protein [Gemmatimonadales bacterium]